jgi:hypothetical protein
LTDSEDPKVVGIGYRTKVVPSNVSDEQLGQWYLNLDSLTPPSGIRWPNSCFQMSNGSSCWPRWIVHKSPSDIPEHKFVARLSVFGLPTPIIVVGNTIDEVRRQLPQGLRKTGVDGVSNKGTSVVEAWDGR